jgi:hypothetical protein
MSLTQTKKMLGEFFVTTPVSSFQGIYDLLPPLQKAPENISGEYYQCFTIKHPHIPDTISNYRATIAPSSSTLF